MGVQAVIAALVPGAWAHSDQNPLTSPHTAPQLWTGTHATEWGRLLTRRRQQHGVHLALVKERYRNVRANVWFNGLDARNRSRVQVSAELPLLYPLGRSKDIPEIKYPQAEEAARPEARPRAGKLEDQPFLATLPVYRCRPEYRHTRKR
jgi:hypothetical protein